MSTSANIALIYGMVITVVSGTIGYGIAILCRHTLFKGRRQTVGVALTLAAIAVVLLLGGAAVREVLFGPRYSVAAGLMVLVFVGTVWYGLSSVSKQRPYQSVPANSHPTVDNDQTFSQAAVGEDSIGESLSFSTSENGSAKGKLNDNELYERAWKEFEAQELDQGLWSRCFAQSDGDENKAKAMYLTERVKTLREEEQKKLQLERERKEQIAIERGKEEYNKAIESRLEKEPSLRRLADVDAFGKWGETKLMEAARAGDYEEVIRLLAAGANPTLKERYSGDTASKIAEEHKNIEIARMLQIAEHVYRET